MLPKPHNLLKSYGCSLFPPPLSLTFNERMVDEAPISRRPVGFIKCGRKRGIAIRETYPPQAACTWCPFGYGNPVNAKGDES